MTSDELEVTGMKELEKVSTMELVEEDMIELLDVGLRIGGGGMPANFGGSALVQSLRSLILFTPSKLNRTYERAYASAQSSWLSTNSCQVSEVTGLFAIAMSESNLNTPTGESCWRVSP